jgi:hypothetical protein
VWKIGCVRAGFVKDNMCDTSLCEQWNVWQQLCEWKKVWKQFVWTKECVTAHCVNKLYVTATWIKMIMWPQIVWRKVCVTARFVKGSKFERNTSEQKDVWQQVVWTKYVWQQVVW